MPYGMTGSNYAAGDYYRGDYYQGDPGILGSLFKGVTGAVKGFITGGPVGAIAGGARALIAPTQRPQPPGMAIVPSLPPPPVLMQQPFQPGFGVQTPDFRMGYFGGGQKEGQTLGGGFVGTITGRRGHPNKSAYVTRGGGTSHWPQSLQFHPKGSTIVTSRRMNVGNARALKRAIRRARGFERLARSVMIVHRFKRKATKSRKR